MKKVDGHFHRRGCHGWRACGPAGPEGRWFRYIGPCRCGRDPHAHYLTKDGRVVPPYWATREWDAASRIAFLEEEARYLKERMDRVARELETLRSEQTKGA